MVHEQTLDPCMTKTKISMHTKKNGDVASEISRYNNKFCSIKLKIHVLHCLSDVSASRGSNLHKQNIKPCQLKCNCTNPTVFSKKSDHAPKMIHIDVFSSQLFLPAQGNVHAPANKELCEIWVRLSNPPQSQSRHPMAYMTIDLFHHCFMFLTVFPIRSSWINDSFSVRAISKACSQKNPVRTCHRKKWCHSPTFCDTKECTCIA